MEATIKKEDFLALLKAMRRARDEISAYGEGDNDAIYNEAISKAETILGLHQNPVRNEDGTVKPFMVKAGGKPFSCACGCNVFHKPDDTNLNLYECNACGEWLIGN